jgi:hypothetical protein
MALCSKPNRGISKVYFVELPKEVQERFGYGTAKGDTYSADQRAKLDAAWKRQEPMATSGVEGLAPITDELKNEMLNALKMTNKLDELYKRGCSSAEFIAVALPIESVFMNLQRKLPKGDPRRDLLANTFETYQQVALVMKANEQGKGERPDATIAAAGIRKGMLTKVLEGNMTPNEKTFVPSMAARASVTVKYLEIIAANLRNAGWNCGCISSTDHEGRQFWVVAAERERAGRYVVRAYQKLAAFTELESAIYAGGVSCRAANAPENCTGKLCSMSPTNSISSPSSS